MPLRRLLILCCFVLFAGTGAYAQSRREGPSEPSLDAPASVPRGAESMGMPSDRGDRGAGSRMPSPPPRLNDRYVPRGFDRYGPPPQSDPVQRRYDSLRSRYVTSQPPGYGRDLHQAVESARRIHGGKVLSAERMQMDGRDGYRVKLLTPSGRVRIVQMPNPEVSATTDEQQGEQ